MPGAVREGLTVFETVFIVVIVGLLLLIAIPRFTAPTLTVTSAPDSVVAANASGAAAVRVTNRNGKPQPGIRLQFEATGGGAVTPGEVETDSTGTARVTWHAAADSGRMRIVAHLAGRTAPEVEMLARITRSATPTAPMDGAQPRDSAAASTTIGSGATTGAGSAAAPPAAAGDSAAKRAAPPSATP